jgi:hypothetical protein
MTLGVNWQTQVHAAAGEGVFKPLGLGGFLDLSSNPNQPFERIPGGFRAGRNGLRDYLELAQSVGVSHVALNPKVSQQPYAEILDELAEFVLPQFPSHP